VDAAKKPSPLFVILRDLEPGRESPIRIVHAESGASFAFEDLPPGRYCVAAESAGDWMGRWAPESECAAAGVDLQVGESKIVNLR
jgi:hypothetical protein